MTIRINLAKKLRLSAFICLGAFALAGCSPLDADVINETVEFNDGFSAVRLEIAGDLTLERAALADRKPSADVSATADDADALTFEVIDSVLSISSQEANWNWSSEPVRITLYYDNLNSLTVAGSGDIVASSLSGETLSFAIQGSGDIVIAEIDADRLTAQVTGSGDIEVGGKTNELRASVQGSGDIDALALSAQKAVAAVTGSGDIELQASAHLDASVVGSGDIRYAGSPEVSQSVTGSGDVSPAS